MTYMTEKQRKKWRKHVEWIESLPKDSGFVMARYMYQERTKEYIEAWMKRNP